MLHRLADHHKSKVCKLPLPNNLELGIVSNTKYPQQNHAKQYYQTKNDTPQRFPHPIQRISSFVPSPSTPSTNLLISTTEILVLT